MHGARIREIRRLQKRTLKDIADRCQFTVSLLSKIESGKSNPPVATLTKIAHALGVTLSDLLESPAKNLTAYTAAPKPPPKTWSTTDKGYSFQMLASNRPEKLMQPILFSARKGKIHPGPMNHSGEEFVYVLEGSMKYTVGGTTHTLNPGDSLYFNAESDHDLDPITPSVTYLAMFSERTS